MCKPNPFFAFFGSIWLVVGGALVPYLLFSEPQGDKEFYKTFLAYTILSMWAVYHLAFIILVWTTTNCKFVFSIAVSGLILGLLIIFFLILNMDQIRVLDWHDIPTWSGEILWFLIPFEIALNSPLMVWVTTAYIRTYPTWSEGTLGYTLYWWIREE
ncbi:uncharacterized protein LOC108022361 isoform X1 [Drosophila biarmipes]|uniref:uncharacterized protein LOC108022361 isoform X1 n=1 Tax=Drosophila biarmipes TaxID=125945 RepID=UPI0021CCDE17|nr:uncharacterized protein LOC108022361 isoform X1 [Drosophila biarmipes]